MFTYIRSLFSKDLLVELSEGKLTIKVFGSDVKYEDEPYIAVDNTNPKKSFVLAIGSEAKVINQPFVDISNPFQHTRSFVADFMQAERILMHGVQTLHRSGFRSAPRVIMHQLEKTEGGLTSIEDRVLRELALGAGAREVMVYLGERISTDADSFDTVKKRVNTIS